MQPTSPPPQPKASQTQEKIVLKVAFGATFYPQHMFFHGLGLILCRKQTTRNPTHPTNYLRTQRVSTVSATQRAFAAVVGEPQVVRPHDGPGKYTSMHSPCSHSMIYLVLIAVFLFTQMTLLGLE